MDAAVTTTTTNPHPTITKFASILDSSSSPIPLHLLKKLHCRIIAAGISTHYYIHTKLLFSYAASLHISNATHLLFSFPAATRRPPAAVYNAVIAAHSRLGLLPEAAFILRRMLREGRPINHRTLPPFLKACALLPAPSRLTPQLHAALLVHHLSSYLPTSNALITAYCRCGLLLPAQSLFHSMLYRNAATWSAIVAGAAINGDPSGAVRLFEMMIGAGVEPDATAFTAVLTACVQGGMVEEGCGYFEMMGRMGVRAGVEHYTCMVELVGRRGGRVEEAERLAATAAEEVMVDDGLWRALMAACRAHGKVEIAQRVARKIGLFVFDK